MFSYLANPIRFEKFAKLAEPVMGIVALISLPLAFYLALFASPAAQDHGETVRILYVHVAAAWSMMAGYSALAIASFVYFIWRHPLADIGARAIAVPGIAMTVLCLATGSLWGKPAWNTWWQWDGRMTSVLLLLFIYLGYFAIRTLDTDRTKSARLAAIVAMIGAVNLPIIKFSVDWWAGLHQPATLSAPGAPGLPTPLLVPLLCMVGAYTTFYAWYVLRDMRANIRVMASNRVTRMPTRVSVTEVVT